MATSGYLTQQLSRKTFVFGFKLWVVMGIGVGAFILVLLVLSIWLLSRKRPVRNNIPNGAMDDKFLRFHHQNSIPNISKEIQVVDHQSQQKRDQRRYGAAPTSEKIVVHVDAIDARAARNAKFLRETNSAAGYVMQTLSHAETPERGRGGGGSSPSPGSFVHLAGIGVPHRSSGTESSENATSSTITAATSPPVGTVVPEVSHLGWGHWYTLRELEDATDYFADANVLGEGGYGIVYKGKLPDGSPIAVKNLLNNKGQAEREFRVEVEAIGRVRHKNLVRLLGYCVEGNHRMLVYEYVDNGNLDQWLHGPNSRTRTLSWDSRIKIVLGTAKAYVKTIASTDIRNTYAYVVSNTWLSMMFTRLTYLHEALEPKVVHRDIKSSNILIDTTYHAKISDFGLAKLLGAGKSHVTTRVMGTFGYVAPEYANTGLLNERSDVYSFGVLLMEVITGRDPVDYSRTSSEVNLVDWIKLMVGQRRSEEVADPRLDPKPAPRMLKRALLVALRCVDPDSSKRPKMGHVVHMLEADEFPFRDNDRRANRAPQSPVPGGVLPQHVQRMHQPPQLVEEDINTYNSNR